MFAGFGTLGLSILDGNERVNGRDHKLNFLDTINTRTFKRTLRGQVSQLSRILRVNEPIINFEKLESIINSAINLEAL
jgi:hypothetical protein